MIPEEDPAEVEASIRRTIEQAAASYNPPRGGKKVSVEIKRLLLSRAMKPLQGNQPLVQAIQRNALAVLGEAIPALGTPLYTDVRLYVERGIPGVIYGAGPRTVLESHAKRADERLDLHDLRAATKVIARTLFELMQPT
jgi:succinyl-diaminopimelate desuccinylase